MYFKLHLLVTAEIAYAVCGNLQTRRYNSIGVVPNDNIHSGYWLTTEGHIRNQIVLKPVMNF
jgi:hypothetical protein